MRQEPQIEWDILSLILSYANCYTAALGKLLQAEVVTDDPEFQKLRGEIKTAQQND
jgi:hypothetical protein